MLTVLWIVDDNQRLLSRCRESANVRVGLPSHNNVLLSDRDGLEHGHCLHPHSHHVRTGKGKFFDFFFTYKSK